MKKLQYIALLITFCGCSHQDYQLIDDILGFKPKAPADTLVQYAILPETAINVVQEKYFDSLAVVQKADSIKQNIFHPKKKKYVSAPVKKPSEPENIDLQIREIFAEGKKKQREIYQKPKQQTAKDSIK